MLHRKTPYRQARKTDKFVGPGIQSKERAKTPSAKCGTWIMLDNTYLNYV
ncbi:MAG: hypothetical protein PHP26_10650 [Syntrophomonas sp.]|nr:hypothetical protein [Syntrophomonas sp.]